MLRNVRGMVSERRTARKALLDAVLGEDLEPWSFAPCSSATEDAPQAADDEEVLDVEILQSNVRKLSGTFHSDELSEILAASTAPPPPPRVSGRVAAMSRVCSWEPNTDSPPDTRMAWGSLAQRYKLGRCGPGEFVAPADDDLCCAPFVRTASDASTADTFHRRQMPAQVQGCFEDLHLSVGEDDACLL